MKRFILTLVMLLISTQAYAAILVFSPNGTFVVKPDLATAATAADVSGKTVVVTSALSATLSNISSASVHGWPTDRKLKVEKGGSIGNTTLFKFLSGSTFEAGKYKIFTGSGRVKLYDMSATVFPEWWGWTAYDVDNTYATSNRLAFQAAIDSLDDGANPHGKIELGAGTYRILGGAIDIYGGTRGLTISGAGPRATVIKNMSTTGQDAIRVGAINHTDTNSYNVTFRDFEVDGNGSYTDGNGIHLLNCLQGHFENWMP